MAGGWNTGPSCANAQDAGAVTASSNWTTVTTGGSAFTKGSWTQLVASTAADTAWVMAQCSNSIAGGAWFAYDIGVGASGSEVTIVSNLVCAAFQGIGTTYAFPLGIKAGSRISVRASSDSPGDSGTIKLTLLDDNALSSGCGGSVDTYGFNTATNNGVTVDPGGTANTKGAYAQISSSLTNDIAGFFLGIDDQNLTTGTGALFPSLIDIAVGASGSEKIILPNILLLKGISSATTIHYPDGFPYFPIPIKAGTRVAARSQCSSITTPDRKFGLTLYGVRL